MGTPGGMRRAVCRCLVAGGALVLFLCGMWFLTAAPVAASTFTVTDNSDDPADPNSLRYALNHLAAGGNTISFTITGSTTISLSGTGLPAIAQAVTIDGATQPGYPTSRVVLDGTSAAGSVFTVNSGVTVTLNGLTIQHGQGNACGGGNTCGGGISNQGTLSVTNSIVATNAATDAGGGINNESGGTLTVTNSTLSNNSANNGGGIKNFAGTVTVTNSTFSGNSSTASGGGISNGRGTVTVTSCTFSGNADAGGVGSGITTFSDGTVTLTNTIVANSPTGGDLSSDASNLFSGTSNLIDDAASAGGFTDGMDGNSVGHPALLGPLGTYGSANGTQTFALLPDSPAINAGGGVNSGPGTNPVPAKDQRGKSRVGGAPDIGAFESGGFTLAYSSGDGQSAPLNAPFATPLAVTVTATAAGEPVDGGQVSLAAPTGGHSATFTANPVPISGGVASVTATANGTPGPYAVTASAQGVTGTATFHLTNVAVSLVVNDATDGMGDFTRCATGNANTCRLRDAIAAVAAGNSTITFDATVFPANTATRITLNQTAGTLTLTANMTIDGTGHKVVVDGGCTGCDPGGTPSGGVTVFQVGNVTAALNALTIQHGNNVASSGGGIVNFGTLIVTNSTLTGNRALDFGGGIFNGAAGHLTVTSSTLNGNHAGGNGGGIFNLGTLTMTNSTLTGNSAQFGAGLENAGSATVTSSTVAGNNAITSGGGLRVSGGTMTLTNTLVATSIGGDVDSAGGTLTGGNNLIDDATTAGGFTDGMNGNVVGKPVLLGTLGIYGSANGTQTIPLLPGSPAINAGAAIGQGPAGNMVPATDQRGKSRVNAPDIGAFESQGFILTRQSGDGQSTLATTAFPNSLVVTLTASNAGEPVAGGQVTFTVVPNAGAQATFGTLAGCTNGNGNLTAVCTVTGTTATSPALTANATAGSFTVTAAATGGTTQTFTLTNTAPTIAISPGTLPGGVKNIAYTPNTTLTATGGTAPYTFMVTAGTLPPGLQLSTTGALTGTPTATGQYTFTVTATDKNGFTGTQQYTISITPAALVSIAVIPANATLKVGQQQTFTATGTYADSSTQDLTAQVTWASDATSVATVDSTGKATGMTPGTAHITARQGTITSGQATVTVTPPTGTGITVNPSASGRPSGTTSGSGSPNPAPNPAPVAPPSGGTTTGPAPVPVPTGR